MARIARQLSLPAPPTWGGRRAGAGRKRVPGRRPSVPHRSRPAHVAAHPVHVTRRAVEALRCFRSGRVFRTVRSALAASSRGRFRVIEFSVQDDHIHLIAEAADGRALAGGIRGLAIRLARAVNRVLGRRGRVFGEQVSRPGSHDAPRGAPRPCVCPYECSEAPPRRARTRSMLLCRMVHGLARSATAAWTPGPVLLRGPVPGSPPLDGAVTGSSTLLRPRTSG